MRFGPDPGQTALVQWFFCDDDALELGFPTPFTSRNYVEAGIWPDIGEVEGEPRPWANGSVPVPISGRTGPCGPRSIWGDGWQGGPMPTLVLNDFAFAVCCMGQVDTVGWPILEIIALDQEIRKEHYQFHSVLAARQLEDYEFESALALQGKVEYSFDSALSLKGLVTYEISAVLSPENGLFYSFSSVVKSTETSIYNFEAAIAERKSETYDFSATLGGHGSLTYEFHSVIAATSGVFIHGPGSGIWTTPGGIYSLAVYLWGWGGFGSAYGAGVGGSGGGGSGFVTVAATPTLPGHGHSWAVQPETGFIVSSFFLLSGSLQVTPGGNGDSLGGGVAGVGSGGDLNFAGGHGGQFGDVIGTVYGAGGGGSAGPAGPGNDGQDATLFGPGQGGAAISGWGSGGQGGTSLGTTHGIDGGYPGSGGGGQGYSVLGPLPVQAVGAGGLLIVCWNARIYYFHGVLKNAGQTTYEFSSCLETFVALTADDSATFLTADDGVTILTVG
jgi:hypothetical protein